MLPATERGDVGRSVIESCCLVVNILDGLRFWTRNIDACGAPRRVGASQGLPFAGNNGLAPTSTVTGGYPCCGRR